MLKSLAIGNQTKWELGDYNLIFVDFFFKVVTVRAFSIKNDTKTRR